MDQQHKQNNDLNEKRKSNRSPPYALFNLLVIIVAILYAMYYQLYLKDAESIEQETAAEDAFKIRMFTSDELKNFNGEGECQRKFMFVCGLNKSEPKKNETCGFNII